MLYICVYIYVYAFSKRSFRIGYVASLIFNIFIKLVFSI